MADKKTCFVIMRFESPYEERCERIYEPAIVKAGLEPRLARGPGVAKITDAIKEGIKNSRLCLIDISEDNPNVWSELGIALNCHGRMAMVCDVEKRKMDDLPTDIRDRQVIPYRGEIVDSYRHARDGFRLELAEDLRLKAGEIVAPVEGGTVAASSQNSEKSGDYNTQLDADEIEVMRIMLHYGHSLKNRDLFQETDKTMGRMHAQLALDGLCNKGFLEQIEVQYEGPYYITKNFGKSWCHKNKQIFLDAAKAKADNIPGHGGDIFSEMDDVPF